MQHEFGANGAVLDNIEDDYQLGREQRRVDAEICFSSLVGFHGCLITLAWASLAFPKLQELPALQLGLAVSAIFFLIGGFAGFFSEEKKRRAPSVAASFDHITGFGAFVGLVLLGVILAAAILGQINYPNFVVPEEFGIGAILILAIGFVMIAFVPKVLDVSVASGIMRTLHWLTYPLNPLGKAMSVADAWLVYGVAPAAGCTLNSSFARYAVLTVHLASATALAWALPPPYGLIGTAWAILAAIAIARRWAWVETERQRQLQDPRLRQTELRVGTETDLRDEALWSLILLVIVLPIGIRQFYLAAGAPTAFALHGAVRDDPWAWFGFFGVELLKALPFIDWADIYGAHGLTRISANGPLALHAIFAARVLIDLVFIGALVQAISISVALSRHKRRFLQNLDVHILDERVEKSELARLARRKNGEWQFRDEIEQFVHYDDRRLSRLRMSAQKGTRLHATLLKLFERKQLRYLPPGEQLIDIAKDQKIDRPAMEAVLKSIHEEGHLDIDYLAEGRRLLNNKGDIEDIRQRVVQLMISVPVSPDRNAQLLAVLTGPYTDSLAAIRILAAQALARIASRNPEVIPALLHAAEHDRANTVRRRVAAIVKSRRLALPTTTRKGRAA